MNARHVPVPLLCLVLTAGAQERRPLPTLLPTLDAATRITATAGDEPLDWSQLLDRLAGVDVVFLGETHLDDTTHRAELAVLEGLLARRQGKVVLSLEMFERDVQPALDDYLAGRIDEPTFLGRSRPWQNYRTAYRPLVEAARAARIPVVAANFPVAVRRQLGAGGKKALDALAPAQRAWLPETIHPASDAYWERVDRAVRGHMGASATSRPKEERLYEGQNLWDNAMGDSVVRARAAYPDHAVLHIAGGFHVAWHDGTVAQFRLRSKDRHVVVSIVPVPALHAARPDRERGQADFLIHAQALARDQWEGSFAVTVPAELRYRLSVPAGEGPWPLLVWLPDRAMRPEDALAFWTGALREHAAVVVVEPPFPELQDDLAGGGRFAWGDGFRADYSRALHGLERIVEHVTRRLPVAGGKVVVAGAGDGGAAVLWTALYGEWLEHDLLAIDPTDLTRLSMEALPDQKPATRSLQLAACTVPKERLEKIAADYLKVGTPASVVPLGADGLALEELVRKALALALAPAPAGKDPVFLVLESDLPRARQWAELHAQRLRQQGTAAQVVGQGDLPADADPQRVRRLRVGGDGFWPVASFAAGKGVPLAGGPFGGTTVLVLPAGTSEADRAAWNQLEQSRAIKQRSMFANLAIARMDGEPSLPQVLEQLQKLRRSRVLVVPATFCADAATMQALRQQVGTSAAGMDLSWLPGLGAELAR